MELRLSASNSCVATFFDSHSAARDQRPTHGSGPRGRGRRHAAVAITLRVMNGARNRVDDFKDRPQGRLLPDDFDWSSSAFNSATISGCFRERFVVSPGSFRRLYSCPGAVGAVSGRANGWSAGVV